MSKNASRAFMVTRRLALGVAMAFLFTLLGILGGIGYKVYSVHETLVPHSEPMFPLYFSYTEAKVSVEGSYNPVLHPYRWLTGVGWAPQNFTMIITFGSTPPHQSPAPHHGGPSMFVPPGGVASEKERQDSYVMYLLAQNVLGDLGVLLLVMLGVEASRQRLVYLVLFAGMLGYLVFEVTGALVCMFASFLVVAVYKWKMPEDNSIARTWNSLWE